MDALVYFTGGLGPTRTARLTPGDPSASRREDPLSGLPKALLLSACAGPVAHLAKWSMRLRRAKPPTAAESSHLATQNLPELTTRMDGGAHREIHKSSTTKYKSYNTEIQRSTRA